jgi:hypothetical protein
VFRLSKLEMRWLTHGLCSIRILKFSTIIIHLTLRDRCDE